MINSLRKKPQKWLTLEDCEIIFKIYHESKKSGAEPIPPFSTRYEDVLESILGTVEGTFDGKLLFPTVLDAAAAYFNKFIRSQWLANGNKRLGVLYTHYFLLNNGIDFTLEYNELFHFAALIADSAGVHHDITLRQCRIIIKKFTKNK